MRLLLVEDDTETARYLTKGLRESGHTVEHVARAEAALAMPLAEFDVLIVDRMLPGLDGLGFVDAVRRGNIATPVLFLSALGAVDQRVEGLRVGGDDYLVKPYAFTELLARIEALGRRGELRGPQTKITVGDLEIDLLARRVSRSGRRVDLQPREFSILECLARNAGRVVTRTMLLEQVWGYRFDPQTNVIDVHISRLRGKLEREGEMALLHTVRGAGYRLSTAS